MSTVERNRILFIGEGATLAHATRPLELARNLDPHRFEITVACAAGYDFIFSPNDTFNRRTIRSQSATDFLAKVAQGRPIFDAATYEAYIAEDVALIEELRPRVVVGDLRLSLSVSARRLGVPYIAISNAYWSPYAKPRYVVPEHPTVRWFGLPVAALGFRLLRPAIFAAHTLPLNRVRRRYGQSWLPSLQAVYTDADYTLYADVPAMIPIFNGPPRHRYLGPVLWSPHVPLPPWWDAVPKDRPMIYMTLGSSGDTDTLPTILAALAPLPVSVLVATAGRSAVHEVPANAYMADFLPGLAAAARSALVICNGGSPTTAQALINDVPVIGIASNLDQYLNMTYVENCGAGRILRAGHLSAEGLRDLVVEMLGDERTKNAAARIGKEMREYDAPTRFRAVLEEIIGR